METFTKIRAQLFDAMIDGKIVVVNYQRNGAPSGARGRVVSVTPTHVIVALEGADRDTTIPLDSVRHVSRVAA